MKPQRKKTKRTAEFFGAIAILAGVFVVLLSGLIMSGRTIADQAGAGEETPAPALAGISSTAVATIPAIMASIEPPEPEPTVAPAPEPENSLDELISTCTPNVHTRTMKAIIGVESGGNTLAININADEKPEYKTPTSEAEAAEVAQTLINAGYSIDMGLMQINSKNLARLKLTPQVIFDPCTNLKAGAQILTQDYDRAIKAFGEGQNALLAALSAYNTGNQTKGFKNGYVNRYFEPGKQITETSVPALESDKAFNVILKQGKGQGRGEGKAPAKKAAQEPEKAVNPSFTAALEVRLATDEGQPDENGLEVTDISDNTNPYTAELDTKIGTELEGSENGQ